MVYRPEGHILRLDIVLAMNVEKRQDPRRYLSPSLGIWPMFGILERELGEGNAEDQSRVGRYDYTEMKSGR